MKSKAVTQWFDGDAKPVRAGWFQREYDGANVFFSFFDGEDWRLGAFDKPKHVWDQYSPNQNLPWRGLAVKP